MTENCVNQPNWTERHLAADSDIRMQIGALRGKSGLRLKEIAEAMDMPLTTVYKRYRQPDSFKVSELRRLEALFERYGLTFRFML